MNIIFKKVKIQGFLSVGNAEVELDNKGFVLVRGINNCSKDNSNSNGVGKSAILEAVLWSLTGETSRGTKDVVNRYTQDGTKVELEFSIDKDNYKIIRTKDDSQYKTNLFIYVNGENKSGKGIRDGQEILESYLPDLNAQLLGSVIILGQGLPQRFTNNTPAGRKEVLEKLSKSDFMIQDIKDKLSKRKTQLSNEIRTLDDSLLRDKTKVEMSQSTIHKYKKELETLQNPNTFNLEEKETTKTNLLLQEESLSRELEQINALINENKNKHLELVKNESDEKNLVLNEYKGILQNMNDSISEEKANINSLNKEIVRLKNIKDVCPTCGQKLPNVHKIDTSEMEQELELRESTLNNLTENLINKTNEQNSKLNQIRLQGENKQKDIVNVINNLTQSQSNKQLQKDKIKDNISKIDNEILTYKLNLEQYENTKNKLLNDMDLLEKQVTQINENILYNNNERDIKNSHLEIVNKMSTIANRDFRGFLLTNVIEYISNKAKEYSKYIFGSDSIDFKLEGNNIFIGYCDKSYESLSGGEKQKVDLIVQFSIRDMLSQFLNFTSNILCLDEIFDGLDNFGCQRVIDMVSNRFNDVSSIFIITHHDNELAIPYDEQITLIKNENGVSGII